MKALRWSAHAEADLYDIADRWEATTEEGAGQRLLEHIVEAPLVLCEYPDLGRRLGGTGLHKWLVRRTPFLLLYRVEEDAVEVARVLHRASDWAAIE